MWEWLGIAVGAALGAPARYAIERVLVARIGPNLPWGTLVANLVGSLIAGCAAGLAQEQSVGPLFAALVAVGFCGALTTFSGFCLQIVDLSREPPSWRGMALALFSVGAGAFLVTLGFWLGVTAG